MKIGSMIYSRVFIRKIPRYSSMSNSQDVAGFSDAVSKNTFELRRAVLLTKSTRLEYLRRRYFKLTTQQLETYLRERGTDFDMLIQNHNDHKQFEEHIKNILVKNGVETKVLDRYNYNDKHASWADIVFSAGGDGTFLLAASRILSNTKAVVGLNTDPARSEGRLCLPQEFTEKFEETVQKIKTGKFIWKFRSRIRVTIVGTEVYQTQTGLDEQDPLDSRLTYFDIRSEPKMFHTSAPVDEYKDIPYQFPCLALNEAFMSENLAARVTHFDMKVGDAGFWSIKSSGLCVCTGSGSTSWHLSMNRLTEQSINDVFNIMKDDHIIKSVDSTVVRSVAQRYNSAIPFADDHLKMCYTIRDMISANVWPNPKNISPRGYAQRIEVRSKCLDGSLVLDGSLSFSFNDGTFVILEIYPEDNLRTISFK